MRTIVLIEPICRGSRLQILANTLAALQGHANVILITRRDYQSPHFDELIVSQNLLPRIVTIDSDLGGAWMRNLLRSEFDLILHCLVALEAELSHRGAYYLVFMALDDYLAAFSVSAFKMRRALKHGEVRCLKYRVEYLFALGKHAPFRSFVLRLITRWALWAANAKLIAFDERLTHQSQPFLAGILPDPWFGPFSPGCRATGRTLIGVDQEDFVLLTLGKQDHRKGIDFLMEAYPQSTTDRHVKLVVVGSIAPAFAAQFEQFKGSTSSVIHIDGFVPESELPQYFAAADAFLLPYSGDFTATSGTLARAAASGVPTLATSHGLVGYRVKTYGLGETFAYGDPLSFAQAVSALRHATKAQQDARRSASLRFAQTCALPQFEESLRLALAN